MCEGHDAKWVHAQLEKFTFDFDAADKDKSGELSVAEVLAVLKTVGFNGTEAEGREIFKHLDRNQDRKINRNEFLDAMKGLPKLSIKEFVLRKLFKAMDKDGSGGLTKDEIMEATNKEELGMDVSTEKISDMLVYLIHDKEDQKIDYEEFLWIFGLQGTATVMGQVFAKLDFDNSGTLSKKEIMDAIKSDSELKLNAGKIADLLNGWCKDDDKKFKYGEFIKVWLKQKKPKK